MLGRGELTKALTVRAHAFSAAAIRAIEGAGGRTERLPLPWRDGVPPPRGTPSPTDKLGDPAARGGRAPPCSPACGTCSGCPTCATRSSSRSDHRRRLPRSAPTCRSRTSTSTRSRTCRTRRTTRGVVGFLDLFSGGAITNVAIFFLGIMPYITASIIMQLLGVVIPKLEQWQNEGQVGQKKITQWTRYLTIGLALVQSTGFVFALHQGSSGLLGFAGLPGPRPHPRTSTRRAGRAHRAHLDRRHRAGDVAGRAHHPARHRQRHVDPDLRVGGVVAARTGRRHLQRGQQVPVLHDPRHRHRDDRRASCSSSRGSAASPCSSPNVSSAAACTAARAPTSR